jgi:hypothetical protein
MLSLLFAFQPPLGFVNTHNYWWSRKGKYMSFICALTAMWTFLKVIRNIIVIIQKIIPGFNNTGICDKWNIIRICALWIYFYLHLLYDM